MFATSFRWGERLRAAGIHLGISVTIAVLAAVLVFGLWYPYPYREISGGRELFTLVVTVDVLLGPLITLSIFNRSKPWSELRRDLTIVGLIQLSALGYGLWTVSLARPVHLVFEIDRFRVVHAVDVPEELLEQALPELRNLPLRGPTPLAVRPFKDENEKMTATLAALQGAPLAARPDLWQSYPSARSDVLQAARPVTELRRRLTSHQPMVDAAASELKRSPEELVYVPMAARKAFWTVLLDPVTAQILGFLPLDSF